MQITLNEELLVDSEMVISFNIDYLGREVTVFYLDAKTDRECLFSADCYDHIGDSPEPQMGRIEIHSCPQHDALGINCVGNHWTHTITDLENEEEVVA